MADDTIGAVELVTCDSAELYNRIIRQLSDAVDEPLYPGDERRIFGEALLAVLVPLYNAVNDAARQSMLAFARGTVLDALGERLGVARLPGASATTTLKFTLSEVRNVTTAIPRGTRAKTDSGVTFATAFDATIPAGRQSIEVLALAAEPGEASNGLLPETVTILIDKIPYVASVENTDVTSGGVDGEGYDDAGDDRFRERIRLAPEALSVAGPIGAYEYWAKTADPSITDVAVISETEETEVEAKVYDNHALVGGDQLRPDMGCIVEGHEGARWTYEGGLLDIDLTDEQAETVKVRVWHEMAGIVRIVPLVAGGAIPDEDVLQRVRDTVNAQDVRPMTDVVHVEVPRFVDYDIELTYQTTIEGEAATVEAVEGLSGAIAAFEAEQSAKLGRDIEPDKLLEFVMAAGAVRCDIVKPERTAVESGEVAHFSGSLTVTHQVVTTAGWDV